ncbi:hypothetical protein TNCV_5067061 [Trichonephila clavipes]|nr:hypothetical protein TNCV_5067061 [Trichonephila clavipes]
MADRMKIISESVKHTSLRPCVNTVEDLPKVHFHTEFLSIQMSPKYQRQLAPEVINGIPSDAILIYTDGSQDESNRTAVPSSRSFLPDFLDTTQKTAQSSEVNKLV